jgi:hypothetical protein
MFKAAIGFGEFEVTFPVDDILEPYGNADMILNGDDGPIKDMFAQYKETDWEFLKRVAASLSQKLIPADGFGGIRFFVGPAFKKSAPEIEAKCLAIQKDIRGFLKDRENDLPEREEQGALRRTFRTGRWLELGAPVKTDGGNLYVLSAKSALEGGLLLHEYTLCDGNGFLEPKTVNERLTGVTLPGTVTETSEDKVALLLDIDGENPDKGSRLFPYSTVYSSPDGSGWYFMPEKGDRVSLHFPGASEKDAYAISSVDLPSADPARRNNPDRKSVHTKYGKEILLTPDAVEIRSAAGTVRLYDDGGLEIESAKNVSVRAKGNINVSGGGKIRVSGSEIEFSQGAGVFAMGEDNVTMDGQEVKVGE